MRVIAPVVGFTRMKRPLFGSTTYSAPLYATMLYQVPSVSTSGPSAPPGCAFNHRLRFATMTGDAPGTRRTIALSRLATPWEQPAPLISAYSVSPTYAMSATPLTREPESALVWLL